MAKDYFIARDNARYYQTDRRGYSNYERSLRGHLTRCDAREQILAERELETEGEIRSGDAALECLLAALNRPHYMDRVYGVKRPNAWQPDEELFRKIAASCTTEALDYFVRHQGRVADCGIIWDKLLELGDQIVPGQPLPEKADKLLRKTLFLYGEYELGSDGVAHTSQDDPGGPVTQENDPAELMLLHRCRPDYRVEQDCADALLRSAIFLKYRAWVFAGKSELYRKMLECWKALAPEPRETAIVDEFCGRIRDPEFDAELRAEIAG